MEPEVVTGAEIMFWKGLLYFGLIVTPILFVKVVIDLWRMDREFKRKGTKVLPLDSCRR